MVAEFDLCFLQMMWFYWLHQVTASSSECEVAAMRISTSKSQKRVECRLKCRDVFLPQVEEFKYLRVLFMSDGRSKQAIDRQIGAAAAVMPCTGSSWGIES